MIAVPPKRFAFWFDTRYDFCRAFFVLIDRKMLVYIVTLLHNLHFLNVVIIHAIS